MSLLTTRSAVLGIDLAAHLLRRASFGPTKREIESFAQKTPEEAVNLLMKKANRPQPPADAKTGSPWLPARKDNNSYESSLRSFVRSWWLDHMCRSDLSLTERMVYFYHTHFTTMQSRANYGSALYYQNSLFRHYALGNYKKLATKICFDNAMLMHLDGRFNRVGDPNENFAREFLELYSIGKGEQIGAQDYTNYTEQDIKEAARVFSGFLVDESFTESKDPETGIPRGKLATDGNIAVLHDFEPKRFSEKFQGKEIRPVGNTPEVVFNEVEEFVELVFAQKETARHICRKLYRFFIYHVITDEVESQFIRPLADKLFSNGYEMKPVLETLLTSRHFYDHQLDGKNNRIGGTLIKSPLDLLAGMFRFYKIALPKKDNLEEFYIIYGDLLYRMETQGMSLYEMEDVAGYAAYYQAPDYNRNWIASSTLAQRYSFGGALISGIKRRNHSFELKLDVMQYVNDQANISKPAQADTLLRELTDYLFPRAISEDRFNYFLNEIFLEGLSLKAWEMEWKEYKKTGNDKGVKGQLENLVSRLMQTPEYQLF